MTYSIVALDPDTGELGVGVQTHQPAVGAIVPWVAPAVGAVATQAIANADLAPRALALLERGLDAEAALQAVLSADPLREVRQLAVVDARGNAAAHTGDTTMDHAGHRTGDGYSVQANMMLNDTVPDAMAADFESSGGPLPVRILGALRAAQAEGGDVRGMQSAAILVRPSARYRVDPTWDLRVDDDSQPLDKLAHLVNLRLASGLQRDLISVERAAVDRSSHGSDRLVPRTVFLAGLEQIRALDDTDETLFWCAVSLANTSAELELAAELLTPLLERAPQWRTLLHRLQPPQRNDDLMERFPTDA